MTYENAVSTRLIATHCAVCRRPLRDAVSVERGVGPDCAERYGYGEAQTEPTWLVVAVALTEVAGGLSLEAFVTRDAHALANLLTHQIATDLDAEETNGRLLAAIRGCGFTKLADKLATHLKEWKRPVVSVEYEGTTMRLSTEGLGKDAFHAHLRAVHAACRVAKVTGWWSWDQDRKQHVLPVAAKRAYLVGFQAALPDDAKVTIRSDKGELVVTHVDAETTAEREAIRTEPVATPRTEPIKCPKCAGTGHLSEYSHVQGGVCFRCSGTGEYVGSARRAA